MSCEAEDGEPGREAEKRQLPSDLVVKNPFDNPMQTRVYGEQNCVNRTDVRLFLVTDDDDLI